MTYVIIAHSGAEISKIVPGQNAFMPYLVTSEKNSFTI